MNKRRRYKAKRRRAGERWWCERGEREFYRRVTFAAMDVLENKLTITRIFDESFGEAGIKTTHGRKWIYP